MFWFRHHRMVWLAGLAVLILIAVSLRWTRRANQSLHPAGSVSIHNEAIELTDTGWPSLRGPTFDSHSAETGLAETWPESGPPVLWTRELGQGYSGFSAMGDRVYTQCQSRYRQSVVCLDAATGDTVWSYDCGWPYDGGGLYPGPRSTPTWHCGHLYYATPDGTVGCLTATEGRPVWSRNPKKELRGRGTDFGYACSPVIVEGAVIVPVGGPDASVVALDIRDGSTVWKSGTSPASYATPLPIQFEGRSLVVIPLENSIAAFDSSTGTRMWEIEFSEGYDEHSAAPIYREPFLLVASPFRAGAKRFRLEDNLNDSSDTPRSTEAEVPASGLPPTVTWESPKFSNDVASSVLVDGRVYGFDLKDPQSRLDRPSRGEFRCLDFETGRVIWSTDKVGQANTIVADRKLVLFTDRGELILIRMGTDEYVELARVQVFRDEVCWTYPALHRGCIYLRTQTRSACVYLGEAPYNSKRQMTSVAAIPRGRTFDAQWLIGGEREFPATVPEWSEFRVWYCWSLCGLVMASVTSMLAGFAGNCVNQFRRNRETWIRHSVAIRRACFWTLAAWAGIAGSPIVNARQSEYVLLWPLALWVSFQLTINVISWTERHADRIRIRWLSRGCGLMFLGTCAAYFHLCRGLGYAIEWSFLIGFLPSFVVAAVAARLMTSRPRFWSFVDLVLALISFSAYFWSSVIFIKWKMIIGS